MLLLSKFFRERGTCRNSRRKAISGNTSDGSFFTTSVETIFSFHSWEIKAMVSQMIEWGLKQLKTVTTISIGRLWEVAAYERWSLTLGSTSNDLTRKLKYSEKVVSNERWSQREVRLYLFAYFFICFILQHYVYTTCVSHQGLCETDGLLPKCIINADQLCFGICFNKHTVLPSFYDCWGLSLTITLRIKRRTERGGGGGTVVGKWEWAIVQRLNALGTFYYSALTDNHW